MAACPDGSRRRFLSGADATRLVEVRTEDGDWDVERGQQDDRDQQEDHEEEVEEEEEVDQGLPLQWIVTHRPPTPSVSSGLRAICPR